MKHLAAAFALLAGIAQAQTTLESADVVILGEVHDNAHHHVMQAEYIAQLRPKAVVFEMLDAAQAAKAEVTAQTDLDALAKELGWAESGWPDFALYRPVFAALEGRVAVGAARPRDEVRRAFAEGAAAVFGPQAARFGLTEALPEAQLEARMQMQFEAHCEAMPLQMMGGMVEAQRLRDAAFAQAVLEAVARYGRPVVLVAGAGHARTDWGVPHMLRRAAPELEVYSIGMTEEGREDAALFDHVIITAAARRPDPCAQFKKN